VRSDGSGIIIMKAHEKRAVRYAQDNLPYKSFIPVLPFLDSLVPKVLWQCDTAGCNTSAIKICHGTVPARVRELLEGDVYTKE